MAIKYGGKTISDYSAMRGPCSTGFHVPMDSEWQDVLDILTTIGYDNDSKKALCFMIVLLMPFAGQRDYSTSNPQSQDGSSYGIYWCSTNNYRCIDIRGTSVQFKNYYKGYGYLIRPFKDVAVVPDSSWTKVDSYQVAIGGIYKNTTLGLISLSGDGTNWITITDKNLGATEAYDMNSGYYTEANCGKYFQWGNNYGFPFTGSLTTSSTQVNASDCGPGNYYNSSTFITQQNWDSSTNNNLWGGTTGIVQKPVDLAERYYGGKLVDDYSAMRGPCPEGFHIPMRDELTILYSYMNTLGLTDTGKNFKEKLLLPNASKLAQNTGQRENYSTYAYLKSCNSYNTYGAKTIQIANSTIYHGNNDFNSKSGGDTIRPFKDTSVSPDSSWTALYDGSSVAAGAGVFHNESLGLISVSSDGINWVTLADKNLGATIAYNAGDTLSEANCGKFYQWGNNYGFSWTGATTTSSTKVDASNYGPGNYYSSSIFITAENASSSTAWDTTNNQNLRGGVTGVQQKPTKVIEVYYGSTKIWPSYPAGIYWNPNIDGGVISISSNGTDWLTMADKNLGATTVYNYGDTMTEANCGKYYQWGNNYAFPFSGTPSISSTKVDISSYGPNNYYSNSTFRRVSGDGYWWTSASATAATNLWGEQTNTNEARRGPCPEGFHIPSHNEIIAWRNMTGLEYADRLRICKIPMMGTRDNYTAGVVDRGTDGGMRTTTLYDSDSAQGGYYSSYGVCRGLPIRPFKNEAIMPDDTRISILN